MPSSWLFQLNAIAIRHRHPTGNALVCCKCSSLIPSCSIAQSRLRTRRGLPTCPSRRPSPSIRRRSLVGPGRLRKLWQLGGRHLLLWLKVHLLHLLLLERQLLLLLEHLGLLLLLLMLLEILLLLLLLSLLLMLLVILLLLLLQLTLLCGRLLRLGVSLACRQKRLSNPKLNERLHRLHVLLPDEVEELPDIDEVDEARVQFLVRVEIPERIHPMPVIQMGVAAHHLPVDASNVLFKVLGEPRSLTQPFLARQAREGPVEVRRASRDRRVGARCVQASRRVG